MYGEYAIITTLLIINRILHMTTFSDFFKTAARLSTVQQNLMSGYSKDTFGRVKLFLNEAENFFTAEQFHQDNYYYRECFKSILISFNLRQLARNTSVDMKYVYNAWDRIIYNALSSSDFDASICSLMFRHNSNIKLSRIVSVFKHEEDIVNLLSQHLHNPNYDFSAYRASLVTSHMDIKLQAKLATQIFHYLSPQCVNNSRIFPYIEECIIIYHRHVKSSKSIPLELSNCLFSVMPDLNATIDNSVSKTKRKQFMKDIRKIGQSQYGDQFESYLRIAKSLSLSHNINYWLSIRMPAVDTNLLDSIPLIT